MEKYNDRTNIELSKIILFRFRSESMFNMIYAQNLKLLIKNKMVEKENFLLICNSYGVAKIIFFCLYLDIPLA